jgi:hypothetical protein
VLLYRTLCSKWRQVIAGCWLVRGYDALFICITTTVSVSLNFELTGIACGSSCQAVRAISSWVDRDLQIS